jgi:chemotaxis signal transduction protein
MGEEQWFCLFRGDAGPMAVSVESVAEILETDTLFRLAWSPPQVLGLCLHHRQVVPVVLLAPLPPGVGADLSRGPDPTAGADRSGEKHDVEDRTRWVLLILKTEQGAWGIRSDSEGRIMSRECPEYHPPQTDENGPVLVGIIPHAGTRYRILDAEATWRSLRSAVGCWYGLIGASKLLSPILPGEDLR